MAESSWLTKFPQMDRVDLLEIRKGLDSAYREFSREYGEVIESFFDPLLAFLVWFEKLLLTTPWFIVIVAVAALVYLVSRSWKLSLGVVISFLVIGYFGMWDNTMRTLSIITVCTLMAIGLGIPIGILMARSDKARSVITPMLDIMQTMPAFVYLIPVVMLLGIGKIPGVIAVIIYAIPPVIRLTNLGIRLVDSEVMEAATAYGANPTQRLFGVQLPLAMPTIMAGINQPVLKSITNQYFTLGLFNGLAIVALAIIFDRVSQAYAKRTQRHMQGIENA